MGKHPLLSIEGHQAEAAPGALHPYFFCIEPPTAVSAQGLNHLLDRCGFSDLGLSCQEIDFTHRSPRKGNVTRSALSNRFIASLCESRCRHRSRSERKAPSLLC